VPAHVARCAYPPAIREADARTRAFADVANALHTRITEWLSQPGAAPPSPSPSPSGESREPR